jgi:hypothetical protein
MRYTKIRLSTIELSELGDRSFVALNGTLEPYFVGGDPLAPDLLCGNCGWLLTSMISPARLMGILMQCPKCEKLNDSDGCYSVE